MSDTVGLSERLAAEFATGSADLTRPAQIAGVPIPAEDIASLTKSVRALKVVVDTLTGDSGSVLDKALTTRDLLNDGVMSYSPSVGLSSSGTSTSFTGSFPGGGTGGDGYVDPRPVLTTPPTPTNLQAFGAFRTIILTWDLFNYRNHAYTEIWRATTDNLGTAVLLDGVDGTVYADASGTMGATYWYWVRAVNDQGTAGAYNASGGTSGGLLRVGTTDISDLAVTAAQLADGTITAAKVAAGAIEATKFAAGIEPVTIVVGSTVPTTLSTYNIYLTGTGRLYRWNGSAYVLSVPAADITGTLTSSQIASITAAQLTGQITTTQIADNAITTPLINAGAVTTAQIAANTIVAGNIAAGTITGTEIAVGSVNADRLVASSITAGQIQAGAIGTDQIAANAIRTNQLLVTGRGAALNDDPACSDSSAWTLFGDLPGSFVTISYGAVGNTAMRGVSAGTSWYNSRRIAVDPTKTYRFRCRARNSSGNGTFYAGVALFDSSGVNIGGDGTQWFYAASGVTPSTSDWSTYTGEFGAGTTKTLPTNARTMAALVLLNYLGTTGYMEAQDVRIEEKASADLIVDGAIVASKIAANAIAVGTAAIADGAIENAMMGIAAIDTANIADAAVVTAKIGDAQITTAKIADAQITSAKIVNVTAGQITAGSLGVGSFIQSTAYTSGASGWRINADGSAEFNSVTVRGTVASSNITGSTITGGTITGSVFQTATGSVQRVVINEAGNNEARFYGDRGDGTVEQLAAIGLTASGSDFVVGDFGSTTSTRIAVRGRATGAPAITGIASGFYAGVVGQTTSGAGVSGTSTLGYGVSGVTGSGSTFAGVYGEGQFYGVEGVARDAIGVGVRGVAQGGGAGITGTSTSGYGAELTGNATKSSLFLATVNNTAMPTGCAPGALAMVRFPAIGGGGGNVRLCYVDQFGVWRYVADNSAI